MKSITKLQQLGLALLLGVTTLTHAQDKKPNIVLIIADDMGYSDMTCFGGEVQTQHIDALAKSGIRATNCYVGPTCSPSLMWSRCPPSESCATTASAPRPSASITNPFFPASGPVTGSFRCLPQKANY